MGDSSKCGYWNFDSDGNIVRNDGSHSFTNGACVNCGRIEDHGVEYVFRKTGENTGEYYVTAYTGSDTTVNVLGEYNDGVNGKHNVTFVKAGAFSGKTSIQKVILDKNIKTLDGNVFNGCTNLTYVSMLGVENLDLVWLNNRSYYSDVYVTNDVTANNFMNCSSLTTVVVGKKFTCGQQMFKYHGSETYTACVNIYVEGNEGESSINIGTDYASDQNHFLTGNIYYYSEESATNCWHYGEGGFATLWS